MNIAIVTGASSGMGREFVIQLPQYEKHLDEIWVIARRKERLEALKNELNIPLRVLEGDLTDAQFTSAIFEMLNEEKPNVRVLVNSAGFGKNGSVQAIAKADLNTQPGMVELNCSAFVNLTQMVLPYMQKESHMINLASGSAFCPQPYFTVYAATKAFVLSFSRGLGGELKKQKIFVTAVCPGPVKTEFFVHEGMQSAKWKEPFMAKAERVVAKALKDTYKNRSLSVYGPSMKMMHLASKLVPKSWIIAITSKLSG